MAEPYTVLVADDEKVIRDGCTLLLQPEGYRVVTAANGKEALDLMGSDKVNVVLCDLKMPVMGALEVLQEAGTRHPDIPVIIITGHGTVADAVECMKKGAYDFVTKPFRVDHLTLCVKRALEKQSLERQTRRLLEEQARNLYTLAIEQSRMHTIVNCMADGVLVTNRDAEVVLCNQTFRQLLSSSSSLPLPGPLQDYCNDEALQAAIQTLLKEDAAEPSKCISQELCHGQTHLRALSAPFFGPDQQVLGTVTVFHDITRFKELDQMKSDFVHMVSHELRSPLTAIKLQHGVILDGLAGELTPKQRELMTRAHAKIQGLLDLINDLLDVAKMEAGHRQLEQVPLPLEEVLAEVVGLLQARAQDQKVSLKLSVPDDLPPVLADRQSLDEVFTNLVSNAVNYSPDGGDVTVAAVSHNDYVEVLVSDTGIGIEAEEIPKIFDKFYRVKHPRARQVIGTGLGLAIVKGIIEAHRGSIKVESTLGVGTTFHIFLPTASAAWVGEHAG
ncbi:MAG: response regulator [Desulfobaccales bacterium]|nr:response regulator [Desulfobaccales bacterium]